MDKMTVSEADAHLAQVISAIFDKPIAVGLFVDLERNIAAHRHAAMLEGVRLGLEAMQKNAVEICDNAYNSTADRITHSDRSNLSEMQARLAAEEWLLDQMEAITLSPAAIVEGVK